MGVGVGLEAYTKRWREEASVAATQILVSAVAGKIDNLVQLDNRIPNDLQ